MPKKEQKQAKIARKQQSDAAITEKPSSKAPSSEQISDPRFVGASYDPKFMAPSMKLLTKTKIDKRFSKMMTDPSFRLQGTVDRYGRKLAKSQRNTELDDYYYEEQDQNQGQGQDLAQGQGSDRQGEQIEQQYDEEQYDGSEQQAAAQPKGLSKWMEDYSAESSSQEQQADVEQEQQLDDELIWQEQKVVTGSAEQTVSKRLALCNYDWMNIKAKDLMILFSSFREKTGFIRSVKVYLSDYGKEKIEQEEIYGPRGVWDDEEEGGLDKGGEKHLNSTTADTLNEDKVRRYEFQRLRYYFAVIECDCKATADEVYKQCDGNQFENSNLSFDLRFVPEELQFDETRLDDSCEEVPVSGEVKNFVSRAVGHSKVSLTWEDPDLGLVAGLRNKNWSKMSEEQIDKIDWSVYVNEQEEEGDLGRLGRRGGEESEQGDSKAEGKAMKQAKLEEVQMADWKVEANRKKKGNKTVDCNDEIEITFNTGFTALKEEPRQFESLKKQKKSLAAKRRQAEEQRRQKKREQLELLADDTANRKQPTVDVNDERFNAVYNNASFSIDPVDPHFDHRRIGKVFSEVVKRNKGRYGE